MARREERHWWYAGMRHVALSVLSAALSTRGHAQPLRILDAGCGTGGTTVELRRFGQVVGVDLVWEALLPAAERGLDGSLARGSIDQLPFADAAFDVVTSFEVIYHLGVSSDERALVELRRVLKSGGLLLLRVPAHDWLRGAHDVLVHTRHRYAWGELRGKLQRAGFQVEQLSWANSALFPPAVAKRLLERAGRLHEWAGRDGHAADAEPDLWQPPEPLNSLLEAIVAAEALAIPRQIPLPFGLSLLALARAA